MLQIPPLTLLCYTYTSHGNHPFHIELSQLPPTSSLQYLQEIQEGHTVTSPQGPSSKEPGGVHIGASLPPVPFKLAEKSSRGNMWICSNSYQTN